MEEGKRTGQFYSTNGSSVVDYCMVDKNNYHNFRNFSVVTTADILASLCYMEYQSVSDHSLLAWNITVYNYAKLCYSIQIGLCRTKKVHYNFQNIPVYFLWRHHAKFYQLAQ